MMMMMTTEVAISDIKIGNRFRKDLGDIDGLAKSIEEIGLLHPIVVNENNELVAGHRRIEAAKKLGWTRISCTVINISDLIKGELQENVVRKDFAFSERQAILEEIELERQRSKLERDNKGKRSAEIAADYTGVSPAQIYKGKKIIKAVKENPEKFEGIIEEIDRGEISVDKASLLIDNRLETERFLEEQAKERAKAEEVREDRRWQRIETTAKEIPCNTKGCGKMVTVYDEYAAAYAMCEEHKPNEEKAKYEKFQQKVKHESEVNPLIRYYHDINGFEAEAYDIPFEIEQKAIEEKSKRSLEPKPKQITGPLDIFSDWQFTSRSYKKQIPYDASSAGMSEEEWWKQVERKRLELKEKKKEWETDNKLRSESPTNQALKKLGVVIYGCRCKAELIRQDQYCPVCRLMIKVYQHAERLFKDAAEGRGTGGDMSITR